MAAARLGRTSGRGESASWPLVDRIALGLCWAAGLALCLTAAAIILYMMFQGLQQLSISLLFERPGEGSAGAGQGGLLDPIVGTVIVAAIGTAIALPLGLAIAVWLSEYARPFWLARSVESGVEMVAGTPSVVLAIFGLLVFTTEPFAFLSLKVNPEVEPLGRSFVTSGTMMSLIALPLVVGASREALQAIPRTVREASYALGKTKAATIRRVLVPASRRGIATGGVLGLGRIVGDTAIIVILLGATTRLTPTLKGESPYGFLSGPMDFLSGVPLIGPLVETLRGNGGTLTSSVFENSPAGEGNAAGKAYAAAFILLLLVVLLNYAVDLIARGRKERTWTPT